MGVKYTTTVGIPIVVEYKCSKCGHENWIVHNIQALKSQNSVPSNSERFKLQEEAEQAAKEKTEKVFAECKNGKYDTAQFNIRCSSCGHQEHWSKLRLSSLGCFVMLIAITFVVTGLICLFTAEYEAGFGALGIGAGVYALYYLHSLLSTKLRYKKIAQLPEESLPRIHIKQSDERRPTVSAN